MAIPHSSLILVASNSKETHLKVHESDEYAHARLISVLTAVEALWAMTGKLFNKWDPSRDSSDIAFTLRRPSRLLIDDGLVGVQGVRLIAQIREFEQEKRIFPAEISFFAAEKMICRKFA